MATKHTIGYRVLDDGVLVRRLEAEEKSPGGIIIPDAARDKPTKGEVIEVGPGLLDKDGKRIVPEVKPGDEIIFAKWSGMELKLDNGKEYSLIKASDIKMVKIK